MHSDPLAGHICIRGKKDDNIFILMNYAFQWSYNDFPINPYVFIYQILFYKF